jgi:hypothetical protein
VTGPQENDAEVRRAQLSLSCGAPESSRPSTAGEHFMSVDIETDPSADWAFADQQPEVAEPFLRTSP